MPLFLTDPAGGTALRPMPVRDQMRLQWTFVSAGIEAVADPGAASGRAGA
jgi:hypothetical protein